MNKYIANKLYSPQPTKPVFNFNSVTTKLLLKTTRTGKGERRKVVRCFRCGKKGTSKNGVHEGKKKFAKFAADEITSSEKCLPAFSNKKSHVEQQRHVRGLTGKRYWEDKSSWWKISHFSRFWECNNSKFEIKRCISYVLDLESSLISVSALTKDGFEMVSKNNVCEIYKNWWFFQ